MKKPIVISLIAALALGSAAYAIYRKSSAAPVAKPESAAPAQFNGNVLRYPPGAPQLAYLKIEAVSSMPVPILDPLHGRIAYDDNVTARVSSPIAGRATRIAVQAGDKVAVGQPLLWMDSPDYAQALADLRKAEVDAHQKALAFDRAKILLEGEVLARKDFEAAEGDLRQAQAERDRARSRFRNLSPGGGGEGFALRAPLGGIVTERQANPGTEVRPDAAQPLFVISDPTRLWVMVELSEKDLDKMRVGQQVAVDVDAYPDERFPARVLAIGDVIDPATRRVTVRCAVDNPGRRLKPEMYARVVPLAEGPELPQVPNSALVTEGLHTFLFVETQQGVLEKRPVVLAFRGHDRSFVREGLKPGERVVTSGALLLNAELAGS
jgi:cobalt-zinc-cadmium efflux system membrane fusion protein